MDPKLIGERLKLLLIKKQIKRSYLAKMIGVSYNTLTKKLNGQKDFSAIEITRIKNILELDDQLSANIFFNPNFELLESEDLG